VAARRGEGGFSLVEMLIAVAIAGILFTMVTQMIRSWVKAAARAAVKARTVQVQQDLRRLYTAVISRYEGNFPVAGPWPEEIPRKTPLPWPRPAPGFEGLKFAPSTNPTHLQFHVDGWATGFNVTAIGDLDKDGGLELYIIWGDVGMLEGPLPYPPEGEVSYITP